MNRIVRRILRESYETGTTTPYSCRSVTEARVPTQPVSDLTTDAFSVVEPVTCPALGQVADGTHATDAPLNTNRSPYLDLYFALPPGVSGGLLAMAP